MKSEQTLQNLINLVSKLYNDIDLCIGDLVKSRLNKDEVSEGKAMAQMESLMTWAQQELSYIRDYLSQTAGTDFKNTNLNEEELKATKEIDDHMREVETKFRSAKASSEMAVSDFHFTN